MFAVGAHIAIAAFAFATFAVVTFLALAVVTFLALAVVALPTIPLIFALAFVRHRVLAICVAVLVSVFVGVPRIAFHTVDRITCFAGICSFGVSQRCIVVATSTRELLAIIGNQLL